MLVRTDTLWSLGDHLLYCGDATNTKAVEKLVKGKKISLILCDVPYGVGVVESKRGFSKIKKDKIIINDQVQTEERYRQFTRQWLSLVKPHLASKNSVYIFNSDKMLFALRDGMKDEGYKFAQLLIWVKNNAVLGRLDYMPQFELIAYGWYGTHAFQKSQDKSVIFYPKPNKNPLHPTMKPVGLLRRLILNSSKIGDYVYDGFAGSGSCMVACEQTGRKCLMIELDLEYCQTIIQRFEKLTAKKAQLIV